MSVPSWYPVVANEVETLNLVLQGRSIARYGDGEWNLCRGAGIKSQDAHPVLRKRLVEILNDAGECLVGIPNLHGQSPKQEYWENQIRRQGDGLPKWLNRGRSYVSSFVSRTDSAPWINTSSYWDMVTQLWRGRDVTLVRGSGKAFTVDLMAGAGTITEIPGPRHNAFDAYDELLERIGTPERVLLSLGPTATVLAVDLCKKGVHAIDCGHMGAFYRRWVKAPEVE